MTNTFPENNNPTEKKSHFDTQKKKNHLKPPLIPSYTTHGY